MNLYAKTSYAIILYAILLSAASWNVYAQGTANSSAVNQSSSANGEQSSAHKRLKLTDGTTLEVDDAWEEAEGVWYGQGSVTHLIDPCPVRSLGTHNPKQ